MSSSLDGTFNFFSNLKIWNNHVGITHNVTPLIHIPGHCELTQSNRGSKNSLYLSDYHVFQLVLPLAQLGSACSGLRTLATQHLASTQQRVNHAVIATAAAERAITPSDVAETVCGTMCTQYLASSSSPFNSICMACIVLSRLRLQHCVTFHLNVTFKRCGFFFWTGCQSVTRS